MKKSTYSYNYILLIPFLVLTFFLFRFQIIEGDKYQRIAEHNFVRVQRLLPVRGEIFDRNFNTIAQNKPSSNLYILPVKIKNLDHVVSFLNEHFAITEEQLRQQIYEQRFRSYQELLLVQNVNYETVVTISEQLEEFPSLFFRNEYIRSYNYNNHFTGYVNKISPSEIKQLRDNGYTINSLIGKTGVEKQYEHILKGKVGFRVIQVDATGRSYQLFKHNISTPVDNGSDILLTIDNKLQNYVESIFPEDHNGAIVVLNPQTGGILAYVSRPNYNLNMFSEMIGTDYWQSLVNNSSSPLLDRVSTATYSPASVFKPIMATVALENQIITPEKKFHCTGSLRFGNRTYHCWEEKGHGSLDLASAIKHSCNTYFYALSLEVPLPLIYNFIMDNKFTDRTGIDLPSERRGFFPNKEWYLNRNITRSSINGHKINLSIGQGEVLFTPIQIASFYAAIANNGLWEQPHLFSRVIGSSQTSVNYYSLMDKESHVRTTKELQISSETLNFIQEALYKSVQEQGGTGGAARVNGVNVFGKTGTSQIPGQEGPNALFAGYASWQRPELAMAIIIENVPEGGGGRTAAPIAGRIIRYYNDYVRSQRDNIVAERFRN